MSENTVNPTLRRYASMALAVAVILGGWGVFARISARNALSKEAAQSAVPVVQVVKPATAQDAEPLILPANVQAYSDAPIYARTNGYLRRRLVDIGSRVKKGDLLAEIDTPEVTQQIMQGEANLATAQANATLAESTAARWTAMLATDSVAKQDVDEKVADAAAKRADLNAMKANLNRLRQLGEFQRIVAPFDGVITARGIDVGALVTAGSGPGAGPELFHIASADRLRVYVSVPQAFAPFIKVGGEASLRIAEHPQDVYPARIVSTAESLDQSSRTLLTQLEVDNAKAGIRPGSYGEVRFEFSGGGGRLRIPANALLFRGDGMNVVTVDADNKLLVKPVILGRDLGKIVEVQSGLDAGDRVVANPSDSAVTGISVRVAAAAPAAPVK